MKILLALLLACGEPTKPVIENHNASNASNRAEVKGTAGNAKLGAVIQTKDRVVYCEGLSEWPPEQLGKSVTAHGTLEQSHAYEATVGPNGEQSQGTNGPIWLLKNCTFDK